MGERTVVRGVLVLDGTGRDGYVADVAWTDGLITEVGVADRGGRDIDGRGLVLAPGFIDVHTHDDVVVVRAPEMLPKLSQGVTTVVVGNCGISASPVTLTSGVPDPMNLLGTAADFVYPTFAAYRQAVDRVQPSVNVVALVGHTALRTNHLDRFDRPATGGEVEAMKAQLREALENGAVGLSTGLAYKNAFAAPEAEVLALARLLDEFGGVYTTHMRTEFDGVLGALDEAFSVGRHAGVPVVVSHLKCAGAGNWGRSGEVLDQFHWAAQTQALGCDCYPYSAGSSTLDLGQVTTDFPIRITWSEPHPEAGGRDLAAIAADWGVPLLDAARRLQPAGAVYHNMAEADVRRILADPATMIGSDGLPNDPRPHPRLWGTFPRVLGHYSRDEGLFPLAEAVRKMTSLPAARFGLDRGVIKPGLAADLVLFDPLTVRDVATFDDPIRTSEGIVSVWVNGRLSFHRDQGLVERAGGFLPRTRDVRETFPRFLGVSGSPP